MVGKGGDGVGEGEEAGEGEIDRARDRRVSLPSGDSESNGWRRLRGRGRGEPTMRLS